MSTHTIHDALALLESLGNTPDAIADKLTAMGIRGEREDCRNCPLANYLTLNGFEKVTIETTELKIGDDDAVMPHACRSFVDAFDEGKYDELNDE